MVLATSSERLGLGFFFLPHRIVHFCCSVLTLLNSFQFFFTPCETPQSASQYTAKEWRILLRRFSHSAALLKSAIMKHPTPGSGATPPTQPWSFLYHHTTLVRTRNWLAPRGMLCGTKPPEIPNLEEEKVAKRFPKKLPQPHFPG